jgi:hypothetical protein
MEVKRPTVTKDLDSDDTKTELPLLDVIGDGRKWDAKDPTWLEAQKDPKWLKKQKKWEPMQGTIGDKLKGIVIIRSKVADVRLSDKPEALPSAPAAKPSPFAAAAAAATELKEEDKTCIVHNPSVASQQRLLEALRANDAKAKDHEPFCTDRDARQCLLALESHPKLQRAFAKFKKGGAVAQRSVVDSEVSELGVRLATHGLDALKVDVWRLTTPEKHARQVFVCVYVGSDGSMAYKYLACKC